MVTFMDGPAELKTLMLRRAPLFLRVVLKPRGDWDDLDQLGDEPAANETIVVYRKVHDDGEVHINGAKVKGWFRRANYYLHDEQPGDETARNTSKWRAWCEEQARRLKPKEKS